MANNAGAISTKRILSCKDFADIVDTAEEVHAINSYAHPLIVFARLKEGIKLIKLVVARVSPAEAYTTVDTEIYNDDIANEIRILKLLKQKITDVNISPCIVELEGSCNYDIAQTVKDLKLDCLRLGRRLRGRSLSARDTILDAVCEWDQVSRIGQFSDRIAAQMLERCDYTFARYFSGYRDTFVDFMIFKAVLFMVIYTMYQIRKLYPQFRHGDLHTDNVMIKVDRDFTFDPSAPKFLVFNDDVLGSFKIPYYGIVPKIIDFGFAMIPEEKMLPKNLIEKFFLGSRFKEDIPALLYWIYDDMRYHPRINQLLAAIDPEMIHTEALYTAKERADRIRSYPEILKLPVWSEFRDAKITPDQVYEEYNSPARK